MELNQNAGQAAQAADGAIAQEAVQAAPESKFEGLLSAAAERMVGVEGQREAQAAPQSESSAAPGESGTEQPGQQKQEPEKLQAPAHWSEDHRKAFESLSPEGQRLFLDRHKAMEGNLNRKHQELAEKEKRLVGWEALVTRIQQDKDYAQHVFSYGQQAQRQTPPAQDMAPPEDPLERLKWEASIEAEARIMQKLQPVIGQTQQIAKEQELSSVRGHFERDPLYAEVRDEMIRYVESQPTQEAQVFAFQTLDQNPQFYAKTYAALRERVIQAKSQKPAIPAKTETTMERTATPRPAAPQLESAGGAETELHGAALRSKTKGLVNKIKSNQGTPDDVRALLQATGAFDRMGL